MSLRGVPLELHPSPDYLSDTIRATGDWYEASILDELARRLEPGGGTVVDGGAMVGNHTVYLATSLPATVVHAFEPAPANLVLLHRNVRRLDNVVVHALALSDRPEVLAMRSEAGNLGHTLVAPGGPLLVEAVALDSLGLHDVRLLKLDVEGHERRALEGAVATLERWHPLVLIEDWKLEHGRWLGDHGYGLVFAWPTQQTYLYRWRG